MTTRILMAALLLVATACSTTVSPVTGSSTVPSGELTTTSLREDPGGTSTDPEPEPTSTTLTAPEGPFTLREKGLFRDGTEPWNDAFIVPGPIVEFEGIHHMFVTAHGWDGPNVDRGHVGVITSPDGLDWYLGDETPLFDGAEYEWTLGAIYPTSAHILDDGTWAVWFSTVPTTFSTRGRSIGRATAPGPNGPWTVDPEPVLGPGGEGSWFETGVMHASVVQNGEEWRMYFDGYIKDTDADADRSIGMATSTDGIAWELYDDPSTSGIYEGSDPVFIPGPPGTWDEFRVRSPSVIRLDDHYVMTYLSSFRWSRPGLLTDFGYATSTDGLNWVRSDQGPMLDNDGTIGYVTDGNAAAIGDKIMLYFDGSPTITSPSTTIYAIIASIEDL